MIIKSIMISVMQLVLPVFAFTNNGQQCDMWSWMMGWGNSMGWIMMIFLFLFWGAILTGIIFLIRIVFFKSRYGGIQPTESALDILKKLYVKGDIDKAEFEEKKRVIEE